MTVRALVLLFLLGCAAAPADSTVESASDEQVAAAAASVNEFGLDLYRQVARQPGDVFLSPPSIATALGMAWGGARGETAEELREALHLTVPEERAHSALHELLAAQQAQGDPTVASFNQ